MSRIGKVSGCVVEIHAILNKTRNKLHDCLIGLHLQRKQNGGRKLKVGVFEVRNEKKDF